MNDIILLTPNGKFTEEEVKLSEKSKKELEDLKKELNLPEIANNIRI